ncbi:hypothetical protein Nmel_007527, partial [Mimus melanotis]
PPAFAAGKLHSEQGAATRRDRNPTTDTVTRRHLQLSTCPAPTNRTVAELRAATPGSAELHISTNDTVTLSNSTVFCIPTGIYGPLAPGYHALLIGRSSTSITGFWGNKDHDLDPLAALCGIGLDQNNPTWTFPGNTPFCSPDS